MNAFRKIERASGATLTIDLPEEFRGRDLEIVILPLQAEATDQPLPPELDPRYARYIIPKPPLSEAAQKVRERQAAGIPDPAYRYDDPFEPAFSEDDFDMDFPEPTQKP